MNVPTRVIKLGGSLLDSEEVFANIQSWLTRQPPLRNVWIVGGGQLVDGLRHLHQRFQLNESDSHWLAVDLLNVTTGILADRFSDWDLTSCLHELESHPNANIVFDTSAWLRTRSDVPESWSVTTDSIAAVLASQLVADELVLLKSAAPPDVRELAGLSGAGYCDAWFPTAAANLSVIRFVNFRDPASFPEVVLRS